MGLLEGKIVLVTGAGQAIGREIALAFAKEGGSIAINDIDEKKALKVAQEIQDMAHTAVAVRADVSQKQEVVDMVNQVLAAMNRIDILVNNAGALVVKSTFELEEEEWDHVIKVNLKGTFLCSQAVGKVMMKQGGGKIINLASILGKTGLPMRAAYAASKGGVVQLTKALALEWGPYHINVNALAPGPVITPMTKSLLEREEVHSMFMNRIALNRFGTMSDVAKAALFLASDNSEYITGHILSVDGGYSAM